MEENESRSDYIDLLPLATTALAPPVGATRSNFGKPDYFRVWFEYKATLRGRHNLRSATQPAALLGRLPSVTTT